MATNINFVNDLNGESSSSVKYNLPRKIYLDSAKRSLADGANVEGESCTYDTMLSVDRIRLLNKASLLITPTSYKEGKLYSEIPTYSSDGDLSVTRATTATRVNSAGLVELVPYNLLSYSEQFDNAAWAKTSTTITANAETAPNGTLTADIMNISSNASRVGTAITLGAGTYTISAYVKVLNSVGTRTMRFNLTVDGSSNSYNFSPTTEWARYEATFTAASSVTVASIRGLLFTGDVAIWGAQLVEGTNALPYQKTETRLNIPRLDYSLGGCPSILLEPQRTNLALQSSSFDSATWAKTNVTVTANNTTSPSGVIDADKFIPINGGQGIIQQTHNITASQFNTFSVFAKLDGLNQTFVLNSRDNASASNFCRIGFNLSNGTIATAATSSGVYSSASGTITSYGNGWYRCTLSFTSSSSVSNRFRILNDGLGDGTNGILLWGGQIELNSAYATSYIPTTTASVTRNLETVVKTGATALIGQTEGTMYWEGVIPFAGSAARRLFTISDGTTNNAIHIQNSSNSTTLQFVVVNGGVIEVAITVASAFTFGQMFKIAAAYANNDFVIYINGVQGGTDTSGTVPTTNKIAFDRGNDTTHFEGFVKTAVLWKERLTNDQLEALTGEGFDTYELMAENYNYTLQ